MQIVKFHLTVFTCLSDSLCLWYMRYDVRLSIPKVWYTMKISDKNQGKMRAQDRLRLRMDLLTKMTGACTWRILLFTWKLVSSRRQFSCLRCTCDRASSELTRMSSSTAPRCIGQFSRPRYRQIFTGRWKKSPLKIPSAIGASIFETTIEFRAPRA